MSNCFLTEYNITDSIVVALSTHHYMHSVEYFELRRNFVAADLAPNRDALPQPNSLELLESAGFWVDSGLSLPARAGYDVRADVMR